ncbi:MAG TPA: sigma-70 family RNA polymerase sigma factor [Thermoanaerobaculia bacterium]|nr:sigma-70 family RNA polymerase sigma factor [Thermoanaerobaculia bacterium]
MAIITEFNFVSDRDTLVAIRGGGFAFQEIAIMELSGTGTGFDSAPPGVMAPVPPGADPSERIEAVYVEHRPLLLYLAARKFRVPNGDAEALLQEVFVSYLLSAHTVENVRAWLIAAICNASRHYWRVRGRTESLEEGVGEAYEDAGRLERELTMRQVLGYLQPRCRETLQLHYLEGRTAGDIAAIFDTTIRYAEKLIHKCLKRARDVYELIARVER